MKNALVFLAQAGLIWAVYQCSKYIVEFTGLPIPVSILGMLFLFGLLASGLIKLQYIEKAASFFNKHLGFFFIPISVGLMDYGGLIKTTGLQLLIMIAGSTIIGLVGTAKLTQYLTRKERGRHEHSHSG